MKQAPTAIIEDGKVVNHEELKRYWADYNFRQDKMRRGMFNDLREEREAAPLSEPQEVIHRHINYHSDISKKQWDRVEQALFLVNHLDKKVKELFKKKSKKQGKYIIRP